MLAVADDGTESVAGYAGELHPRACAALGLPERTCAAEVELRVLGDHADADPPGAVRVDVPGRDPGRRPRGRRPRCRPPTSRPRCVDGAGPLLESVRLFDVYAGDQVAAGHRSLAFALRLRAPDRTLTAEEAAAVRDAAVAEASRRTGAVLRA